MLRHATRDASLFRGMLHVFSSTSPQHKGLLTLLICRFTGSAGQAIVSKTSAYLITDSRYWLQAEDELDENWHLIRAPMVDGYRDWQSFLLVSRPFPF